MGDLGVLIPIIGVSIPLVVVIGRFIVQPLVTALSQHSVSKDSQPLAPVTQRLAQAEERIVQLERSLERVIEEQDFHRKLNSGRPESRSIVE